MIRRQINTLGCSFCGRTDRQVKVILYDGAGKPAICNECVATAAKRIADYLEGKKGSHPPRGT